MNRFLGITIVLTVAMTPLIGHAASPQRGPYTSAFIGVTIPQNQDVNSTYYDPVANKQYSDRVTFDPGISIGGSGGYDFGIVRLEGELSYKYAEIDTLTNKTGAGSVRYYDVDGDMGALALMFNVFLDFHNRSPVTPYIGGGIGFASIYLSDTWGTTPNGARLRMYDEGYDGVFAYQVGAGVEIALNRRLSLDIGYRYFATDTARIEPDDDYYYGTVTNLKYESHNATAGVRFKF